VLGGAEDNEKLVALMASPEIRIVSLTVTEKGYHLNSSSGELNFEAPLIAADIADPAHPKTVPGLIVAALKQRRAAGHRPFTVLSCDNLPSNGAIVKRAVSAFAHRVDAELGDWIEANVAFPSTMVDRITPATTEEDMQRIATAIGMDDAWPVVTEPFSQWVVEDNFPLGRPQWELGGAIFSNEIEAWEHMKLRCLNGAHSALSYMGQLMGLETVAEAMASPRIGSLLEGLWSEIIPTLHAPSGADPHEYVSALKVRFRNPAIRHKTAQISMDGSQKLPQRLLAPLRDRLAKGQSAEHIEMAIASWMLYASKTIRNGGADALKDPMAAVIAGKALSAGTNAEKLVAELLSIQAIFDQDLPENASLQKRLGVSLAALVAEFGF
jgi:fructuronate reductase